MSKIPFNCVSRVGTELEYVQQAFDRMHICGDGEFTKKCQGLLQEVLSTPKVLLTTSCTHALEMAGLLLNIEPGDEVIVPSFTFVSTVNAFVLRGAKPVFIDIRPDTLNLNEELLEPLITSATRAIVCVHYAGVACEMDSILAIANRHGIPVIEDNAHGLFARYRRRFLGTFGCLATQSFHETKNFSCGEGGALLINDPQFIERAEILREKGTDRNRFFRGEVDKYTWVDIGSSYLPSDILAAILYAQFELRETIQEQRRLLWEHYFEGLNEWATACGIGLPKVPPHCDQSYHLFYLLLPNLQTRQALIDHFRRRDILSVFHYVPLHLSRMGREFGGYEGQCPVTEHISEQLLRLPMYVGLDQVNQHRILDAIYDFQMHGAESARIAAASAR